MHAVGVSTDRANTAQLGAPSACFACCSISAPLATRDRRPEFAREDAGDPDRRLRRVRPVDDTHDLGDEFHEQTSIVKPSVGACFPSVVITRRSTDQPCDKHMTGLFAQSGGALWEAGLANPLKALASGALAQATRSSLPKLPGTPTCPSPSAMPTPMRTPSRKRSTRSRLEWRRSPLRRKASKPSKTKDEHRTGVKKSSHLETAVGQPTRGSNPFSSASFPDSGVRVPSRPDGLPSCCD